ncbi:MAG: S8 family serine peptidase [Candidatus Nanopelagicales bacterium]
MKLKSALVAMLLLSSFVTVNPVSALATKVSIAGVSLENRYIVEGRNGAIKHLLKDFSNARRLFGDFALVQAHSQDIVDRLQAANDNFGAVTIIPDQRKTRSDIPNDTYWSDLWSMDVSAEYGIDLLAAHDLFTTKNPGEDAVVAVLDTGYTVHPDLAASYIGGYDFIGDPANSNDGNGRDSDPSDAGDWWGGYGSSWHGTHVHGTIAAAKNNNAGVVGVAPFAKVLHGRVLGSWGGYDSEIAMAIRWAAGLSVTGVPRNSNPADVINMSLGGFGTCSSVFQSSIASARNAGTVVVVAAGNEISNASNYAPANCNNVITVAATGPEGYRAWYSNYGSIVDIAAPGGDSDYGVSGEILSTLNSGVTTPGSPIYAAYQGTSMATPHVAGVVALIRSANPSLTASQVENILLASVNPFPVDSGYSPCSSSSMCGSGIVDAHLAVEAALIGTGVLDNQVQDAVATVSSARATISWNTPQDTSNLTGYLVTLAGSRSKCTNAVSVTKCTFTRLKNGTTYVATIQAKYGSSYVTGVELEFMPAGAPSSPRLTKVSVGIGSLTPQWGSVANNGSPITSYSAEALLSSGVVAGYCETTSALSCVITGLVAGTRYKIRITATNGIGSTSSTSRSTYRPR